MSTIQAIAVIILRILAVLMIISQLPWAGIAAWQFLAATGDGERWQHLAELLYQLGMISVGVLLLFFSRPVARLIAPGEQPREPQTMNAGEMIAGGSFLIGIFLLALRLPGVVLQVAQSTVAAMRNPDTPAAWTSPYWHDLWRVADDVLILFVAFWLVLRPASLAGLYRWLRTAGLPKTESVEDAPKAG